MKRDNHLSDNLKVYQREQGKTLSEFSREIGVAKSTLQSVMIDGNTTVDTLIRIANGLDITLDDLVFGEMQTEQIDKVKKLLTEMQWYMQLAEEKRERLRYHLQEIVRLMEDAR